MKIYFSIILALILCSCANVSTSRLIYKSDNTVMVLEIPKEIEAKKLKVVFNAQQGTAEITSETWVSRNQDTIKAQASREKAVLESSSTLVEKATEAAVRGAMKGVVPIP